VPCIILVRCNEWSGSVAAMEDENEKVSVFEDEDAAEALAQRHPLLLARPYQIVELEI